jgi:alkyl sulfatase BDS1-like metallo-beta-lactamase superfamily hydrolase
VTSSPKPATPAIAEQQAVIRARLPFDDTQDFEDARRGLIASLDGAVRAADGRGGVGQLDVRLPRG